MPPGGLARRAKSLTRNSQGPCRLRLVWMWQKVWRAGVCRCVKSADRIHLLRIKNKNQHKTNKRQRKVAKLFAFFFGWSVIRKRVMRDASLLPEFCLAAYCIPSLFVGRGKIIYNTRLARGDENILQLKGREVLGLSRSQLRDPLSLLGLLPALKIVVRWIWDPAT